MSARDYEHFTPGGRGTSPPFAAHPLPSEEWHAGDLNSAAPSTSNVIGVDAEYFPTDAPMWHTDKFGAYVLSGAQSYEELVAFRTDCLRNHPEMKPLLVIDDPQQAFYTAGHALSDLEPTDSGELDGAQYAAHLLSEIAAGLAEVDLSSLEANLLPVGAEEVELLDINENPSRLVGPKAYCVLVPVADQTQAFVGAVQSYFGPAPATLFALIRHFVETHGYELVGLGATYIYLSRHAPLDDAVIPQIVRDVGRLHMKFSDADGERLGAALHHKTHLILTHRNW